jgi:hypothetical protein
VGPSQNTVNTYRRLGRTPCGFTDHQTLTIDCNNSLAGTPSSTQYATNDLVQSIDNTTITITRAGVTAKETWGVPAPVISVVVVVTPLLLK